jgi:hypothetical protein
MIRVTQFGHNRPPEVRYVAARPKLDGIGAVPGNVYIDLGSGARLYIELEYAEHVMEGIIRCLREDLARERQASRRQVGAVCVHTVQTTGYRHAACDECDWMAESDDHEAINRAAESHVCAEVTPDAADMADDPAPED